VREAGLKGPGVWCG